MHSPHQVTESSVTVASSASVAHACGKIILAGEHAVVYGAHALALPVPLAVEASVVRRADAARRVRIAAWGLPSWTSIARGPEPVQQCLAVICRELALPAGGFDLDIAAHIPRGSGVGGSAALAVSVARALSEAFALPRDHAQINAVAFASEQVAHGKPSGVDNTVATYARPLLFRKEPRVLRPIPIARPLSMVLGFTGQPGMTLRMVSQVAALRARQPEQVARIMADIDALALRAATALERGDLTELGALMSTNHARLAALEVSTPELDAMVSAACQAGALGAKLTGGGGGGAMVALCDSDPAPVVQALEAAGFGAQAVVIG